MLETAPTAPRAANTHFNASAIPGFESEFTCLEVSAAFREGMNTTFADGEITLSRETVLNLMHSLGASLGETQKTEDFLSRVFGRA